MHTMQEAINANDIKALTYFMAGRGFDVSVLEERIKHYYGAGVISWRGKILAVYDRKDVALVSARLEGQTVMFDLLDMGGDTIGVVSCSSFFLNASDAFDMLDAIGDKSFVFDYDIDPAFIE